MQASPEDLLVVLPDTFRIIYQIFVWPIVIVGVIGNLGVVFRICFAGFGKNSSLKPFYRSALLSLAISDLLLLCASGANILSFLSQKTLLWSLPRWTCTTIPYLQTVAVLVASLTLAGVAIDRYSAMKSKYPLAKGMDWPWAIAFVFGIWIVAGAASYPVLGTYAIEDVIIINGSTYYMSTLCAASQARRSEAATVFTSLYAVIFIPLATVFIVVHILLALNIWQRNNPGDNITQQATSSGSQLSKENSTASTSLGKTLKPVGSTKRTGSTPTYVSRKRRTVRVILVLIVVFGVCRLPHWSFLLYKLHTTLKGNLTWHIQVVLTSLSLLNAAVHPYLYAFLNEALSLVTWLRTWCAGRRRQVTPIARPTSAILMKSTISAKIPRGPYRTP